MGVLDMTRRLFLFQMRGCDYFARAEMGHGHGALDGEGFIEPLGEEGVARGIMPGLQERLELGGGDRIVAQAGEIEMLPGKEDDLEFVGPAALGGGPRGLEGIEGGLDAFRGKAVEGGIDNEQFFGLENGVALFEVEGGLVIERFDDGLDGGDLVDVHGGEGVDFVKILKHETRGTRAK